MTAPLLLITGVEPDSMADTMMSLQWDARRAVAVRHVIDVERQLLTRIISDIAGIVERVHVDLDHRCVTCALREDLMATLERLAIACGDGRWASIIVHLPVATEATQVCRILAGDEHLGDLLHVSAVVAVVDGPRARADLVGDDLLCERGLHSSGGDRRGVGETNASILEYADVVVTVGEISAADLDLVTMLTRPSARVVTDHLSLDTAALTSARRHHPDAEAWVDPQDGRRVLRRHLGEVWTLELRSDRPFHPDRLRAGIPELGGGERRSRGCFWLPTRPGTACHWDGAGGQISVGVCDHDPVDGPHTRLLITGTDDHRERLRATFEHCLLTDEEVAVRGQFWEASEDGFEQWLGPIRFAA